MARIYRVEYEGEVRYIRLSKRWHPSGVEEMDVNFRVLVTHVVEDRVYPINVGVRIFGISPLHILKASNEGIYDAFCASDVGQSIRKYPQLTQIVDYLVNRIDGLEHYTTHHAPMFYYDNGRIQEGKIQYITVDGSKLEDYAMESVDGVGGAKWGSGVEYHHWWALEPWQSLSATVAHRPKVRIASPHTGKRELVELEIPPRHIPIHVTRIN